MKLSEQVKIEVNQITPEMMHCALGVTIIGQQGVSVVSSSPPVCICNVPTGQTAALHNIQLAPSGFAYTAQLNVGNCSGRVILERVLISNWQYRGGASVANSGQVYVINSTYR